MYNKTMCQILQMEVIEMSRQLSESQAHGEQHQFIDDYEQDLARLLARIERALEQLNTTAEAA